MKKDNLIATIVASIVMTAIGVLASTGLLFSIKLFIKVWRM